MDKISIMFRYEPKLRLRRKNTATKTVCSVKIDDREPLIGSVTRHPHDLFNKLAGRKYALANAIKSLPKNERKEVWEVFKKTHKLIY